MSPNSLWIVLVFAVLGLMDTLYLSYHALTKTDVACWWFPSEWCKKVQYSKYSKTLGVPNPYLGFLMYAAILVLAYQIKGGAEFMWALKAVVGAGFLFSLYFTFIQAFVLRAFCTWCVISAVNFLIMFVTVFLT